MSSANQHGTAAAIRVCVLAATLAGVTAISLAAMRSHPPEAARPATATRPASQKAKANRSPAHRSVSGLLTSPPVPESPPEFNTWYSQQLSQIASNDAGNLYRLALTCSTHKRPDLAAEVCRRILSSWPNHIRAKSLLRVSTRQLAAAAAASQPATTEPQRTEQVNNAPLAILTPEAIGTLRFEEFCPKDMDDRPRVVIPHEVIQEFLAEVDKSKEMTEQEKEQFRRSANDDKLRWIIHFSGDRFLDRIRINTEPRALTDFRHQVWPIVSRGCALPTCHGGNEAGQMRLLLPMALPAVGVTNFYILSKFGNDDGRVIDRTNPEASLLLQYGLPADEAEVQHPTAIAPLYRSTNDRKYGVVLDWIRSLRAPSPDYAFGASMWQPLAAPRVHPVTARSIGQAADR